MSHSCLCCGSPCAYTGLTSSEGCSNIQCKWHSTDPQVGIATETFVAHHGAVWFPCTTSRAGDTSGRGSLRDPREGPTVVITEEEITTHKSSLINPKHLPQFMEIYAELATQQNLSPIEQAHLSPIEQARLVTENYRFPEQVRWNVELEIDAVAWVQNNPEWAFFLKWLRSEEVEKPQQDTESTKVGRVLEDTGELTWIKIGRND